jgi:hypothetical protein
MPPGQEARRWLTVRCNLPDLERQSSHDNEFAALKLAVRTSRQAVDARTSGALATNPWPHTLDWERQVEWDLWAILATLHQGYPRFFSSGLRRKRTASTTAASWEFTGKHKLTSQTPYLSRTNVRGQGFRQGFRGQGFSLWCEWIVQTLGLESTVRPRGRPRKTAP